MLKAISPVTGESLGPVATASRADIEGAMARARSAGQAWRDTPLASRLAPLRRLKNLLIQHTDAIVEELGQATGKPAVEALASDILVCVDMLDYHDKHAEEILETKKRPGVGLYRLNSFGISQEPHGVVAVIAPWNHPLQLSLVPLASALVAGNTVLLKPSELTPTIGQLLERLCQQAEFPADVVQVLQGDGSVGQALVEAGPDLVFFTGSVPTGRAVMRAAAEHPVPVHLELGGKDPMIVFADALLERAASGAIWGAFAHAGQNCVAVERLYVERSVHDRFVQLVADEARKLRVGSGMDHDLGPLIRSAQLDLIEAQVQQAIDAGARAVVSAERRGNRLGPIVLTGVDHSMTIMREETFGPVLPIMAFTNEAEVIGLANDSPYGLNASVWTADRQRALRVADRLSVGNVAINDVLKNIGNPSTPFGGVKQSGFGRYHGPEGLRAFCRPKTVMTNPQLLDREPNWFPYGENTYQALKILIHTLHSDEGGLRKLGQVARSVGSAIFKRSKD